MTIVFLAVNASYSHSSLAAWTLRAALPDEGWHWHTVEVTIKDAPQAIVDRVAAFHPQIVAATLYLFNRDVVLNALTSIRMLFPDCLIAVGGPECLGDNRALVRPLGVADLAIKGEGERAFPDVLRRWRRREGVGTIAGVCSSLSGPYQDNGTAECVADLDAIPPFYSRELVGFKKPFIQLETSRGCGNGCLFCTSRESGVRTHTLDRVRLDLREIEAAGIREVRVVDRTFNEEHGRALALTTLFRDDFPGLRFHLEIDPARFGDRLAAEFAKAGPDRFHVEAGVQSLSPAVYEAIGRKATVSRTLEGLHRLCTLRNIEVHVDLIAGLPRGTWRGSLEDVAMLISLDPAEIQLERLKLLPGTPLADDSERWGIKASATTPYQVLETPDMPTEDLGRVDRLSKILDWYYNQAALHDILTDAVRHDAGFLEKFEGQMAESGPPGLCPNLEDRFKMMDRFLEGELRQRLRYRWYRMGFSCHHGPCPASPWKKAIPQAARRVEGDAGAAVTRIWRVELDEPHLFCYGKNSNGDKTVVAVYRI